MIDRRRVLRVSPEFKGICALRSDGLERVKYGPRSKARRASVDPPIPDQIAPDQRRAKCAITGYRRERIIQLGRAV